jgi:hypothetical protein
MADIQDHAMSLRLLGGVPLTTTKYSATGNTTVSTVVSGAVNKRRFWRVAVTASMQVVLGTNTSSMAPVNVGYYMPANTSAIINNGDNTYFGFIGNGDIYVTEMEQAYELPIQVGDTTYGYGS